jgi:hypothetical protein
MKCRRLKQVKRKTYYKYVECPNQHLHAEIEKYKEIAAKIHKANEKTPMFYRKIDEHLQRVIAEKLGPSSLDRRGGFLGRVSRDFKKRKRRKRNVRR